MDVSSSFESAAFGVAVDHPDRRRFCVKHALRSLEDALRLLEARPAPGIEVSALQRVHDDLAVVLRLAEAECQ